MVAAVVPVYTISVAEVAKVVGIEAAVVASESTVVAALEAAALAAAIISAGISTLTMLRIADCMVVSTVGVAAIVGVTIDAALIGSI